MSDDISSDIAALYRASATEEPDASLDAAILHAARRQHRVPQVALASFAVLLVAATVIAFQPSEPTRPAPPTVSSEAHLPPGMADGRGRLLAIDAEPQRIGMNVQPMTAVE